MSIFAYDQNTLDGLSDPLATNTDLLAEIDSLTKARFIYHRYDSALLVHDAVAFTMNKCVAAGRSGVNSGSVFKVFNTGIAINSSVEFENYLYMGGLATGNVTRWDGQIYETDEASAVTAPIIMAVFRETLLAFGTQSCKKRNLDGTWSAVSMPVGTTSFKPRAALSYKDVLYIGGYDDATDEIGKILAFDGTTLTVARTLVTGSDDTDVGVTDLCVEFGYLYYSYNAFEQSIAKIGRFDGSSWTDSHKDFWAQVPGCTLGRLYGYRGNLYVGLGEESGIYASPGSSTSGTYTLATPYITSTYDFFLSP